jgi:LPS sulfotransferase NodH
VRYLHVAREDKVAQAVSLWTAVQTHRWRDDASGGPDHEPVYSFPAIDHLVAQLEAQDRAWQQWFLAAGVEPVRVRYDDLVADPSATVLWVLDQLGIPADRDVALPPPRLRQQAGARSREWADRYVAQRAAAA